VKLPTPEYELCSIVYFKVNPEMKGMVTGYTIRPGGVLLYLVTGGEEMEEKECWGCELTEEKGFDTGREE
jgi:hypothetical protein